MQYVVYTQGDVVLAELEVVFKGLNKDLCTTWRVWQ
jgi:hypothetical protein